MDSRHGRWNFDPEKGLAMLIPQCHSEPENRQGSLSMELAELRRLMADPSLMGDGARQRLKELTRRLARVRALGDEYARVGLSEYAGELVSTSAGG
jgi:hypothetical protein